MVQIKAIDEDELPPFWQWFARNVAAPLERDRKVRARLALVTLCPNPELSLPPSFSLSLDRFLSLSGADS